MRPIVVPFKTKKVLITLTPGTFAENVERDKKFNKLIKKVGAAMAPTFRFKPGRDADKINFEELGLWPLMIRRRQ